MNRIQCCLAALAALAGALVACIAAAPAALATPAPPDPNPPGDVVIHTVVAGGMPGWQIALIVAGAAVLAAVVAVLADRAWAARRLATAPAHLEHDRPAGQDLHLQGRS